MIWGTTDEADSPGLAAVPCNKCPEPKDFVMIKTRPVAALRLVCTRLE